MAEPKYKAFTSPVGVAVFPWISKADTLFDASGKFHTGLAVEPSLAEEFIAELESVRDEFIATLPAAQRKALNPVPVYTEELTRPVFPEDATEDQKKEIKHEFVPEPTGNVLFKSSMRAKVTLKDGKTFEQAPTIVDASTDDPFEGPVYDGAIIRLRGQIVPYTNAGAGNVGITLRMKAVQVIETPEGTGGATGDNFWTEFPS